MMIKNMTIVGMGALGLLFGGLAIDNLGTEAVTYVLDEERFKSYRNRHFTINGNEYKMNTISRSDATPADLAIVAVKYNALPSAIETIKNCVDEHTILLSLMNGIDSEEKLAENFGKERVLGTIAQGMDAMKFGDALTYAHTGELRIGVFDENQKPLLEEVKEFFDRAKIPYTVDEDILHSLWGKFMLNVGVNQTCMVYNTNYAGAQNPGKARNTMIAAMREVQSLAAAEGIILTEDDVESYLRLLGTLCGTSLPSMAQDAKSHRPSEVEMFAGEVIRRSKKYGLPTPVNSFIYNEVKKIESTY